MPHRSRRRTRRPVAADRAERRAAVRAERRSRSSADDEPAPADVTPEAEPRRRWPSRTRAAAAQRSSAFFTVIGLALLAFAHRAPRVQQHGHAAPHPQRRRGARARSREPHARAGASRRSSRSGSQLSRAGERFDPSVPRGFILSQDPPPETPVRGKKRVLVVVSLGEEFSSVPELFGESLRSARYLLERAGLRVGGITRAPSDEVGEGLVAGSDPPAESVLPRDAPVSLLVSSGTGEESFVMPDLLGPRDHRRAAPARVARVPRVHAAGGALGRHDRVPGPARRARGSRARPRSCSRPRAA